MVRFYFIRYVSILYGTFLFYMIRFYFIWYVSILYGTFLFYMVRFHFIWYVSILYGTFLFYMVRDRFCESVNHGLETVPVSRALVSTLYSDIAATYQSHFHRFSVTKLYKRTVNPFAIVSVPRGEMDQLRESDCGIKEHYKKKKSHRGSYIYGTVISGDGVLSMCSYEDYFNGTYLLICPMCSQCVQLKVRTLQINRRHC